MVQAGYFVIPRHLEVGVRGSGVRKDTGDSDADLFEASSVLNWFFLGHGLKAQLAYTTGFDEAPGEGETENSHRVDVQFQAAF